MLLYLVIFSPFFWKISKYNEVSWEIVSREHIFLLKDARAFSMLPSEKSRRLKKHAVRAPAPGSFSLEVVAKIAEFGVRSRRYWFGSPKPIMRMLRCCTAWPCRMSHLPVFSLKVGYL